jgi:hypothetical protein
MTTPLSALLGGVLIGLAAVAMMALHGRVAGISGIVARLLPPYDDDGLPWRTAFVAGLVLAPLLVWGTVGAVPPVEAVTSHTGVLAVAGLLVGFGAVLGAGCTSGHGVCGLSRFSVRSLVATVTFMTTAGVTVYVVRHVIGG